MALPLRHTYGTACKMQSGISSYTLVLKRHKSDRDHPAVILSHCFLVCHRCSTRGCHVTWRRWHVEPHVAKCCHVGAITAQRGAMRGLAQPSAGRWWISPVPVAEPTRCCLAMNPSGVHRTEYGLSDPVAQLASIFCPTSVRCGM